jgi:hypothetical protein
MRSKNIVEWLIGWQGITLGVLCLTAAGLLHDQFVAAVVLAELGAVLIALSLLHIIYEHFLRQEQKADVTESMRAVMKEAFQGAEGLQKYGVVRIHERLPIAEIQQLFSAERERIRILTTWIHEYNAISPALREAVHNGTTFEILMLKPESVFARQRGLDLGYEEGHGQASVQTILRELRRDFASPELKARVHVRFYDCLPSFAVHMAGETAIVSACFPHYTLGTQVLQLEVRGMNTPYGRVVAQEFEHLWKQGEAVEL